MDVKLARDADLPAYAKSLIEFKARQLMQHRRVPRSEEEDIRGELTRHLVQQWPRFDPARASLHTFIDRVLDSAARMILRDRNRLKRGGASRTQSLDAETSEEEGSRTNTSRVISNADQARRLGVETESEQRQAEQSLDLSNALTGLPPDLREFWDRRLVQSEATVAKAMNRSKDWIRTARGRLRKHFENAGFGNS